MIYIKNPFKIDHFNLTDLSCYPEGAGPAGRRVPLGTPWGCGPGCSRPVSAPETIHLIANT